MKNSTRNLGIDILRILSMLGVVCFHVLGHGGILNIEHTAISFSMVWFLQILVYPVVNCFVLITGYIGYKDDNISPKIKSLLSLMFTVAFYSILIFLAFTFLGVEPFNLKGLAKNFLPTIFKNYWFFSAYFGLFLFSPLLNLLVQKSNLKQAFIFLSVFLFSVIISVLHDTFSLLGGFTLIWFIFIYLTGAFIKKFKLNELLSKKWWLIIALLSCVATWLSKIVLHFSGISFLENHSNVLVKYVSPTIVLMAIALLCLFSKINCNPSFAKTISFFASSAFSVYLIHDNIYVRTHLISKIHTFIGNPNFLLLALFIICFVLAIFLSCILIDKIRISIFKFLNINKLSVQIEKIIRKTVNNIYLLLEKACKKISE
ncbi:MAG: acyltransferase [Clostridia bacterium]|nr:acyltransferase [Clostridia bacterium]